MGERSIYGFLDISPSSSNMREILSKYEAKYRHAQKNSKIEKQEDWAIPTMRILPLIKDILVNARKKKEYDEYCLRKAKDEILRDFSRLTEKDSVLHKSGLDFIVSSGEEKGVDKNVILKWVIEWANEKKVTVRDTEVADKGAEEILEEDFVTAVSADRKLYPSTIRFLYKKGKTLGFNARTIAELIDKWAIKHKAEVKIVGKEEIQKPLGKTYYEILGVSREAGYEEIKKAYGEEFRKYIHSRDKAEASVRFAPVKEAWECLRDSKRKEEYDKQLEKEKKSISVKGTPRIEITDENGREKKEFEFKGIRLWATPSISLTVRNGGGGILDAGVRTSHQWLLVDTNRIHQSKLPQKITITVNPKRDKKKNYFGSKGKGFVEISFRKGSYTERERIYVRFSVELPQRALRRFRLGALPTFAIIGGAIGIFSSTYVPSLQAIEEHLFSVSLAGVSLIAMGLLFVIIYAIKRNVKRGLGALLWMSILGTPFFLAGAYGSISHNAILAISGALYLLPVGFFFLTKPLFRYACRGKRNVMLRIWIVAILAGVAATATTVFGEEISWLLTRLVSEFRQ